MRSDARMFPLLLLLQVLSATTAVPAAVLVYNAAPTSSTTPLPSLPTGAPVGAYFFDPRSLACLAPGSEWVSVHPWSVAQRHPRRGPLASLQVDRQQQLASGLSALAERIRE